MVLQRVLQTLGHLKEPPTFSILNGPTEPALSDVHLGSLLDQQSERHGQKTALVCSSEGIRYTYSALRERSRQVARGLLAAGIARGDVVGIFAGNCAQYVELFFACGRLGAILAVLNTTYTPDELRHALGHSRCKVLFITSPIGPKSHDEALDMLRETSEAVALHEVILLKPTQNPKHQHWRPYEEMVSKGDAISTESLGQAERAVDKHDVCNLQFTSGTTGNPKAAMLTHYNIINNARFIGDRMELGEHDALCCPPPLFHCFGLVLGLLATVTHGSAIVFPSETFEAEAVLRSVLTENCTALHGVPAMWAAEMQLIQPDHDFSKLRTGIAAGSATPRQMMEDLVELLNLKQLTNTYGMTETSPASFMTSCRDPLEKRLSTVGKILPHTSAKIIDPQGNVVPTGAKGELCVAGYLLQKGYWNNPEKTNEVMIRDEQGILWMHTGDEASFDKDGYCRITGRIKDIIIRGGENMFPLEIEERLMQHSLILNASVVGIKDPKYGEVAGAFLQPRGSERPSDDEIRDWVRMKLARHKAPKYIFWLGDKGVGNSFPLTGSGKVKKNVLRDLGDQLIKNTPDKRS